MEYPTSTSSRLLSVAPSKDGPPMYEAQFCRALVIAFVLAVSSSLIWTSRAEAQQECQACDNTLCQHPTAYAHDMHSFSLPADGYRGSAHGCVYMSCEAHGHPYCTPETEAQVTNLWSSLEKADAREILDLAGQFPDVVVVNAKRQAVQLVGCDGQIVGHQQLHDRWSDILLSMPDRNATEAGTS